MKGEKINSIAEFDEVIKSGVQSVWVDTWRRPSPIAFIRSWQYVRVAELIERGYLFHNLPTPPKDRFAPLPFQKKVKL